MTLEQLVSKAGIALDANGMGLCPFHEDKSPSLSVDLGKGLFKCFGCQTQGSAVDWLIAEGLSKKEALDSVKPIHPTSTPVKPPQKTVYQWIGPHHKTEQYRTDFFDGRPKDLKWKRGTKSKHVIFPARPKRDRDPSVLVFAEGAKSALAIARAGYAACGIGSSSSVPVPEVLDWVFRKSRPTWVLWPDNHDTGREAMERLARTAPRQARILIATPPSRLGKGEDAADCKLEEIAGVVKHASPEKKNAAIAPLLDWELDSKERPIKDSPRNSLMLLQELGYTLRWDVMGDYCVVKNPTGKEEVLEDKHWHRWFTRARERYDFSPTPVQKFQWYCYDHARRSEFHPILDYLAKCPVPAEKEEARSILFELAQHGFSVHEEDELSKTAIAKMMAGAVRRINDPGCMWKYIPVLFSEQEYAKSSAISSLCPDRRWILDTFDFGWSSKERGENLAGVWLVEASEIDDMKRIGVSRIKAIISSRADRFRKAFGHESVTMLRKSIFIGTVNSKDFLFDTTGNSRFWPIQIQAPCDPAWIAHNRDRVWGAAVEFEKDENLWMDQDHLEAAIRERQEDSRLADPWEDVLDPRLDLDGMSSAQILDTILQVQQTRRNQMRLSRVMRDSLGYDSYRRHTTHGRVRYWRKPDTADAGQEEIPF